MRRRMGSGMVRISALCLISSSLSSYIIYGNALRGKTIVSGSPCLIRRPDMQNPLPRASRGGKAATSVEGGKDGCQPQGQRDDFFPAPAYGRCSETCEAAIWNGRIVDGRMLRVALPATRTDLPPCKAAWLAKSA